MQEKCLSYYNGVHERKVDRMATISLRVDGRQEQLFREYARMHRMSVSELLRSAAIERIEADFDLTLFDKAMNKVESTHSLGEVKKELGLDG